MKSILLSFVVFLSAALAHADKLDESKPLDKLIMDIRDNKAVEVELALSESKLDLNAQASNGDIPLESAIANHRNELMKLLLLKGADPNKELQDGSSMLYRAVRAKNETAIEELFKYGADVNYQMKETGNTVLHIAVQMGDVNLVKLLKKHTPKQTIKNNAGKIAVEMAPKKKIAEMKRLLN